MKKDKKTQFSWAMYDFGNSAFATTMLAAILPIFYSSVAANNIDSGLATSYWGYANSIAVLIVAILAPVLGAIADFSAAKKKFLRFFAFMGMVASISLAFTGQGDYIFVAILFIIGSIGFSGANVFYDAFLPEVADEKDIDKVSTRGFALGYVGGGILLLVNVAMILKPGWFGLADQVMAMKVSFAMVGLWWLIFSIPLFKNIHDEKKEPVKRDKSYMRIGFSRIGTTFREISRFKQLLLFLFAFWLFNDGISTIIRMATIYGTEIGIGQNDLIVALLITQFVGIPSTFFFGWLAGKITAKRALMITLFIYLGIVIIGYFMNSALHFYLLATAVGFVQGGAQALSRSIYGRMIPENKKGEFFGFYGISSKFSAVFGPFVFGFVGQITGNSRFGILSLIVFFIAGIILLSLVNVQKGVEAAKKAA
ncbi:MFS transporter [Ornithinibacillus halotolerans]|uniref:MFS transporter n=1 Tax=Ornithinibacillus halotolerans TaxID=1274357 RepID=A0A916W7J1_9BACI|nr:MFS transporter [Ornithinibacillus halotolerans]GGA73236.1 MFS transporter [Ornithinibacillus halotolerans]